jgi:hypothetical protein
LHDLGIIRDKHIFISAVVNFVKIIVGKAVLLFFGREWIIFVHIAPYRVTFLKLKNGLGEICVVVTEYNILNLFFYSTSCLYEVRASMFTSRLNILQLYFLSIKYIFVLVRFAEQATIISQYTTDRLVCAAGKGSVYCALLSASGRV